AVNIPVAYRTGLYVGEIRARIGLGEHRRRQNRTRGDRRQPAFLLLRSAVEADKLAGDFRAGAERTYPEIGARQPFGHERHRGLTQPQPAMLFGDRYPEHPDPGEVCDDRQRDELVAAVPFLSARRNLALAETAHLLADHFEGRIVHPDLPKSLFALF